MCGFVGFLGFTNGADKLIDAMTSTLTHRGPDHGGIWFDKDADIALGHRRLSILDLSECGRQPMTSSSGRFILVFNGEIYNHKELRANLDNVRWRGQSDTETLLAGFDQWGIINTINKVTGMFAFALWDTHARTLTLGRDRLGEKPVYYGWQNQGNTSVFLFGSELKALRIHPAFNNKINRSAISLFLRLNNIPAPLSIYEGISKLKPGCLLTVSLSERQPKILPYWSLSGFLEAQPPKIFLGSAEEAVGQLDLLLGQVVSRQMISDVPFGAFLSGGIDSSTIVALMQSQTSKPIKTFTIGFKEKDYDESNQARAIANHLGTRHYELHVDSSDARSVIPLLPQLYDEPFADSSQIPTFLLSKLAREHVKVALSGDGGDELFCGYNRYVFTHKIWPKISLLPLPLRNLISEWFLSIPYKSYDSILDFLVKLSPMISRSKGLKDKLQKFFGTLSSLSDHDLYLNLISNWKNPESVVINGEGELPYELDNLMCSGRLGIVESMMLFDTLGYLPDDILVKLDRAAMGVGLEVRAPYLDHHLVQYVWSLPLDYKLRDGVAKWPLREVLYRYVPKNLLNTSKTGFGVPIDEWLRGPLRDWAEALISESRLYSEGFFYPEPIRKKWSEHITKKHNWQHPLWSILIFQSWLEEQSIPVHKKF